jgi:hypothetical protein
MYLVSSYIVVVRRRQLMPFWLSLLTVGERLLLFTQRENKYIILSFILLILLKPFDDGLVQPLSRRLPGVVKLLSNFSRYQMLTMDKNH